MPDTFVPTVIVDVALLNLPDAPEAGAVKITFTPGSGVPLASRTVTASAFAKRVFTVVCWGVVPPLATLEAGGPPVFESWKLAVPPFTAVATTVYAPPVPLAVNGADA